MGLIGFRSACAAAGDGRRASGQMTVEFAVALPVLIVVAVIAVNALSFFGVCAAFDEDFRDLVRVHATSPAYGQDVGQSCAAVEDGLAQTLQTQSNVSAHVAVRSAAGGHMTFTGTVEYAPTLFGLGLKDSVFGVSLPKLMHEEEFTVDCYKPGVLL